jgi:hypothetical protein
MEELKEIWDKYFTDLVITDGKNEMYFDEFYRDLLPNYIIDIWGHNDLSKCKGWHLKYRCYGMGCLNNNQGPHPFLSPESGWRDGRGRKDFSLPIVKKYNEFILSMISFFSFKNKEEGKKFFLNFALCIKNLKEINIPNEMIFKILSFVRIVEMKEDLEKEYSFVHLECSDDGAVAE